MKLTMYCLLPPPPFPLLSSLTLIYTKISDESPTSHHHSGTHTHTHSHKNNLVAHSHIHTDTPPQCCREQTHTVPGKIKKKNIQHVIKRISSVLPEHRC